ncbi:MAG: FliH/SctL family protein [Actinomycetota bacterium]|nr:FliH/SctL family protein [Actinomycetota bacterium]
MTVASRIRPVEFDDLSHLEPVEGAPTFAERLLPKWIDELLEVERAVVAEPTPIPVELPFVEAIVDAEPSTPEPDPAELAAAEERRDASIAFELGHRAGFDHGRIDGHAEGYRDGFEAGRRAALDAGQAAAAQLLDSLRASIAAHGTQLEALADELARSAAGLAFGIAEQVLQRELRAATDPGADAIRRAVAALPHAGPALTAAVVRLHPDDAARLVADPRDLCAGAELTIVADAVVEPGSCLLDVGSTRVDASVSSALARVREVLAP